MTMIYLAVLFALGTFIVGGMNIWLYTKSGKRWLSEV